MLFKSLKSIGSCKQLNSKRNKQRHIVFVMEDMTNNSKISTQYLDLLFKVHFQKIFFILQIKNLTNTLLLLATYKKHKMSLYGTVQDLLLCTYSKSKILPPSKRIRILNKDI